MVCQDVLEVLRISSPDLGASLWREKLGEVFVHENAIRVELVRHAPEEWQAVSIGALELGVGPRDVGLAPLGPVRTPSSGSVLQAKSTIR